MSQSELLRKTIAVMEDAGIDYGKLDMGYLNEWAAKLDVQTLLNEVIDAAEVAE